jgi:hypothetical protein
MQRTVTVVKKQLKEQEDHYVEGTPEERVAHVWPLTAELVLLGGQYNAEQRLQRNVISVTRREG